MSNVSRIFTLLIALWGAAALACDLDDCSLPEALHREGTEATPQDAWSWMNHDLAVARDAVKSGEPARAIALARDLDSILRTNLKPIVTVRGAARVQELHNALQVLTQSAGGWPLAELDVTPEGAKG